jgi:hypothetical protein
MSQNPTKEQSHAEYKRIINEWVALLERLRGQKYMTEANQQALISALNA